jgi:serine/threonine protein phosphatase 1
MERVLESLVRKVGDRLGGARGRLRQTLVLSGLKHFLRPKTLSEDEVPPRLAAASSPDTVYAIGDIHGCLAPLKDLEAQIVEDARQRGGESWLVLLGDLIDRGPQSAQVLDRVLTPLPGLRRLVIRGNHESTMLDFIRDPAGNAQWLEFGGRETLLSYGIEEKSFANGAIGRNGFRQTLASYIPEEHVAFLASLPMLIETPDYVFVHAGLRPGVAIGAQTDADLLWIRDDYVDSYAEFGKVIVHGHTPRTEALLTGSRIAVDTGAYATGRLTAVRLVRGEAPALLTTTAAGAMH